MEERGDIKVCVASHVQCGAVCSLRTPHAHLTCGYCSVGDCQGRDGCTVLWWSRGRKGRSRVLGPVEYNCWFMSVRWTPKPGLNDLHPTVEWRHLHERPRRSCTGASFLIIFVDRLYTIKWIFFFCFPFPRIFPSLRASAISLTPHFPCTSKPFSTFFKGYHCKTFHLVIYRYQKHVV